MIREVDLVSYLPPFMKEYKQIHAALEAENPEFSMIWNAADQTLRNAFIETADEYGIGRVEKMLQKIRLCHEGQGYRRAGSGLCHIPRGRLLRSWSRYAVRTILLCSKSICSTGWRWK